MKGKKTYVVSNSKYGMRINLNLDELKKVIKRHKGTTKVYHQILVLKPQKEVFMDI